MSNILNQSSVDELFKELESAFKIPSIVEITPMEISNIIDNATRKSMERKFYLVNKLFVEPLSKLLNDYINSVNSTHDYAFDLSPYSIKQRIHMLSKYLLFYGYSPSYLRTLLPHTVDEVDKKIKEIEESENIIQIIDSKSTVENRKIA